MIVLNYYPYTWQGLAGQPRGQAIVSFMAIVESLPTYGVHYYEVRDKHGTTWWLGLSPQGIAVYPHHDKYLKIGLINLFCWRFLYKLLAHLTHFVFCERVFCFIEPDLLLYALFVK